MAGAARASRRLRAITLGAGARGCANPPAEHFPTTDSCGVHPTHDTAVALGQLRDVGFCILDAVIPAAAIPALRESAERTAVAHDSGVGGGVGAPGSTGVWHVPGVLTHDQSMAEWIGSRRVMDVVRAAFATDDVRVTYTTLQVNPPGCIQQYDAPSPPWHHPTPLTAGRLLAGSGTRTATSHSRCATPRRTMPCGGRRTSTRYGC